VNERGVVPSAALGRESRCFDYLYDFGDDWHHVVLVEDTFILPRAEFSIQCGRALLIRRAPSAD
jgi:hypothetical protein